MNRLNSIAAKFVVTFLSLSLTLLFISPVMSADPIVEDNTTKAKEVIADNTPNAQETYVPHMNAGGLAKGMVADSTEAGSTEGTDGKKIDQTMDFFDVTKMIPGGYVKKEVTQTEDGSTQTHYGAAIPLPYVNEDSLTGVGNNSQAPVTNPTVQFLDDELLDAVGTNTSYQSSSSFQESNFNHNAVTENTSNSYSSGNATSFINSSVQNDTNFSRQATEIHTNDASHTSSNYSNSNPKSAATQTPDSWGALNGGAGISQLGILNQGGGLGSSSSITSSATTGSGFSSVTGQ